MTLESCITTLCTHHPLTKDHIYLAKKEYARINQSSGLPTNMDMIACYRRLVATSVVSEHPDFISLLKKRAIRSQSGIVSVQVLTKPFWCPGKCIFCPNDFTMPKSYINTEPGAMRALLNNFDPIKQVYNRLLSLTLTGHETDKIEMIVLGGTRDVYPEDYKERFIKHLYDACNTFPAFYARHQLLDKSDTSVQRLVAQTTYIETDFPDTVDESIRLNESATHRMIGLTIETRPEYVTHENCRFWRRLGVTRLEMGIQSTNDAVLEANKRGHDTQCSRDALHILRQYGFKFSVHLMPGLYMSDEDKDLQTFIDIYSDPWFCPDEIKFYPTSVIPNTELYDLYRDGKYEPIAPDAIKRIITNTFRDIIPTYTRIKRLIRDIPSTEIAAGSSVTNLAQLMHESLYKERKNTPTAHALYERLYPNLHIYTDKQELLTHIGQTDSVSHLTSYILGYVGYTPDTTSDRAFVSLDTRSREIRHASSSLKQIIVIRAYPSSVGQEFFISCEDELGYIYGFARLLLPDADQCVTGVEGLGVGTALVRELHVYGQMTALDDDDMSDIPSIQHTGIGTICLQMAESIASTKKYPRISVIAGVGVREYYVRKHGYVLDGTYMVKSF